jgi:hypothetical protein
MVRVQPSKRVVALAHHGWKRRSRGALEFWPGCRGHSACIGRAPTKEVLLLHTSACKQLDTGIAQPDNPCQPPSAEASGNLYFTQRRR